MKTRAFIAIDIPESVRITVPEIEDARKIDRKQFHITLMFLGYIDENRIEEVERIISCINEKPFLVSLNGIGHFVSGDHGVIFINIEKGKEEISKIYTEIAGKLANPESKKFIPHITVLRLKNIKHKKEVIEKLDRIKDAYFGNFMCDEIKLKKSTLGRNGPVYEDMFIKKLH